MKKFLSLILTLCIICASVPVSFGVMAEESTVYYLKGGATGGDGSEAAPFGTVAEIVAALDAAGLNVAGNEVTVKVIAPADGENGNYGGDQALYFNYASDWCPSSVDEWNAIESGKTMVNVTGHKATLVFESAAEDVRPIIWMAHTEQDRFKALRLGGPTVFNGIDLGINRSNYAVPVFASGYDLEFIDVKFRYNNEGNTEAPAGYVEIYSGIFQANSNGAGNGGGGTIKMDAATLGRIKYLSPLGWAVDIQNWNGWDPVPGVVQANHYFTDEVKLVLDAGTLADFAFSFVGGRTENGVTFEDNVNIVLNGTNIKSFYTSSTQMSMAEGKAVQIIYNDGAYISSDTFGYDKLSRYDIYVEQGGKLDTTSETGVYSVTFPEGKNVAVATGDNGTFTSVGNTLTVNMAGTYNVTFIEQNEDFDGVYYIKGGAVDGDGSEAAPFGTVAEIVAALDAAGLNVEGKEITVKIITPAEGENGNYGGDQAIYFNPYNWTPTSVDEYNAVEANKDMSKVVQHKATIVFESADASARPIIWSANATQNRFVVMRLGGPVVFNGVDIGINRSAYAVPVFATGHDVEFKNVKFRYNNEGNTEAQASMVEIYAGMFQANYGTAQGGGGTIKFDAATLARVGTLSPLGWATDIQSWNTYDPVPGVVEGNHFFTDEVKLILPTGVLNNFNFSFVGGRVENGVTFEDNVNIVLNGTTINNFKTSSTLMSIAEGKAVQIIYNNGATIVNDTFTALPRYDIVVEEDGALDTTDVAGTYTVTVPTGMAYAFVQSEDKNTVYFGDETISVPCAGEYTIRFADSLESIKQSVARPDDLDKYNQFDEWVVNDNGTMTPKYINVIPKYYVSVNGSDDNDGRSYENALLTLASAIEKIEASDAYGLIYVDGDYTFDETAHTQTIFYESYNGGTISGSDNTITLNGPVVMKADFKEAQTIITNGFDFELGGTVDMTQQNVIYAGNSENVTVSGKYVHKIVTHAENQMEGDFNFTVNGGIVRQLLTGAETGTYWVDSVRITVNGGEFWSYSHTDNSAQKAQGSFELIANGGTYYFDEAKDLDGNSITEWYDDSENGVDGFVKVQYQGGKYIVRSENEDNFLAHTDTAGTFAYSGDLTPYYISDTGLNIYYGTNGNIKLIPGAVDVQWTEKFSADDMPTPELPNGFEFLGWDDDGCGMLTAKLVNPNFFYVDSTGDDSGNGSEDAPFKTIDKAVKELSGKTGCIYVIENAVYDVSEEFESLVTIKGVSSDSTLEFVNDTEILGNTKISDITISIGTSVVNTNGHIFEIGENVVCNNINIATGNATADDKVAINGIGASINIGSGENTYVIAENSQLDINIGDTASSSVIKITADNSDITNITTEGNEFASLEIISNGNTIDNAITTDNTWYVSSSDKTAYIDQTETAGTFGVKAPYGKTPIAVADDGTIYVADEYSSTDVTPITWHERNEFEEFINYRKPLTNTYNKIKNDEELTVLYFGGSMTDGYGSSDPDKLSWRGLISQWLVDNFPEANISNINRACGESGSFLGTYRLETDIIARKPDLLFLEYAINDKYFKSSYDSAYSQVETIVREVKQALPETDIVFVIVTDRDLLSINSEGKLHEQGQAHEDVAAKYNCTTLHVGRRLAEYVNYSTSEWDKYSIDKVHLKDSGYRLYYDVVEEYMYNSLFCTDYTGLRERNDDLPAVSANALMDGNRTHYQPTEELLAKSETLGGTGVTRDSGLSYSAVSDSVGKFILDSTSDIFAFEFEGTELALWSDYYTGNYFMISVDGSEYVEKESSSHAPVKLVEGLDSGKHVIKIKIKDDSKRLTIRSLFTLDTTKSTQKDATFAYTDYSNYTFNLPAGSYDVKYLDINTISDLPDYDGVGIFAGWADESGDIYSGDTEIIPGMILVPQISNVDDRLSFVGVQIRIPTEEDTDIKQGLRFISAIPRSLYDTLDHPDTYADTAVGFGSIIIPEAMLDGELTKNTENAVVVPAVKLFSMDDETVKFTVCLTDIAKKNYTTNYCVVPYVTVIENGKEVTYYGEMVAANVYDIAKLACAEDSTESVYTKTYLTENVINAVENANG
ncbi:MAG: SGNH/GDSL hydrolase family protein [Ruminococcaceae bacterium]|nr:SGNH/GDSL hydrolase family protein [Oscillospiraceae bacterium]